MLQWTHLGSGPLDDDLALGLSDFRIDLKLEMPQ